MDIFWEESAESANEAIRLKHILHDGSLNDEFLNDNKSFKDILKYYSVNLSKLDDIMFENKTKEEQIFYRNIHDDIFFNYNDNDIILNKCFTSCFTDNFNSEFGNININIIVPKDTPYFSYNNTIVFPKAKFRLKKHSDNLYHLYMTDFFHLFENNFN